MKCERCKSFYGTPGGLLLSPPGTEPNMENIPNRSVLKFDLCVECFWHVYYLHVRKCDEPCCSFKGDVKLEV